MRASIALIIAAVTLGGLVGCPAPDDKKPVTIMGTKSVAYERAMITLRAHARDTDVTTRANCIEALQVSDDPRARSVLEQGLNDTSPMVRFVAAMSAGKRRELVVKPKLLALASGDPDTNVRVGAIYALYRLGDFTYMQELIKTIEDKNQSVRANTYMVLGMMGDKGNIPLIRKYSAAEANDQSFRAKFELQAALARLGDDKAVEVITSMVYSKVAEDQWNALMVCPDLPEERVINALLWCLKNDLPIAGNPHDIAARRRLIAARSLAKMNKMDGPKLAMNYLQDKEPELRGLAALALGEALNPLGEPHLSPLLDDPDDRVKIAASAAIVNIWSRMASTPK
jgi:HEAT repeat protein